MKEVVLDGSGKRATGVRYLDIAAGNVEREVRASYVVVAGGAFETPRLLLRCGVGNSSDLVGRNLTYHFQTFSVGIFPFSIHGERGRSVTHHHDDFIVPGPEEMEVARRRVCPGSAAAPSSMAVAARRCKKPRRTRPARSTRSRCATPPSATGCSRSRCKPKTSAARQPRRPRPEGRRRVGLRRRAGHLRPHKHELVASDHFAPILEAGDARRGSRFCVLDHLPPQGDLDLYDISPLGIAPASRHTMGTCRMGDDARTSVVNRESRFHDVENMLCADSSVFVTSSGYNPTLTLVAFAHRAACLLAGVKIEPTTPMDFS